MENYEFCDILVNKTLSERFGKCECQCGNKDTPNIITAPDGEVICRKCGTVIGKVSDNEEFQDELEAYNGEADLHIAR